MSKGLEILHSHSGLERELKFPKHTVLIDAQFVGMFHANGINTVPFKHNGIDYYKVPILSFVNAYGVFKNLDM